MGIQGERVSGLERLLFGITRAIALFVAIVALSGIVICSLFLLGKLDKSTSVSYSEIAGALTPTQAAGGQSHPGVASDPAMEYQQLPQNLRRYLTVDDARTLRGRLLGVENDEQWRASVNNLSTLVGEAEARGAPPRAVINIYADLRNKKLAQSDIDKYVATAGKLAAAAAIVGLLFLLIQVSLVLVLLAIERHTRSAATLPTNRA